MSSGYSYNKRRHTRLSIKPLDHLGNLTVLGSAADVLMLPVDVSKIGLGVVAFESLTPGQMIIMKQFDNPPELVVVWCRPNSDEQQTFSCGLKLLDESVNLQDLVERQGWI